MSAISLSTNKSTVYLALIGAGVVLYFYWEAKKGAEKAVGIVSDVVKPVIAKVNPASHDNIVQSMGTAVIRLGSPTAAANEETLSSTIVDGIFWLQEKVGLRDAYGVPIK